MLNGKYVNNIKELSYNGILYGKVFGTAIDFVIVAFIVFMFAKMILREEKVAKK